MNGHIERCRGLSLVEVLIVITILGLIAAIVVPRVHVSTDIAEQKVKQHHAAQINAAIERCYLETGVWVDDISDLVPGYLPEPYPAEVESELSINAITHRIE